MVGEDFLFPSSTWLRARSKGETESEIEREREGGSSPSGGTEAL